MSRFLLAMSTLIGFAGATGYHLLDDTSKRRQVMVSHLGEDERLRSHDRDRLQAAARDVDRNFPVGAWAVNKHLDYTTAFTLHSTSDDESWNEKFEKWITKVSAAGEFDAAGRHDRERFTRLLETSRVCDGDHGVLALSEGYIQGIEQDQIRNPDSVTTRPETNLRWVNGVQVDSASRARRYALHKSTDLGLVYDRTVPADNLYLYAWYRRVRQIRGVSPLAPAIAFFQDSHEGIDLSIAKMKIEAIFGLKFSRTGLDSPLPTTKTGDGERTVDLSKHMILDLDPGEDASFMHANHPGLATQEFISTVIQMGLKALDIPFSFYREDFTNYFGSIAAWRHYDRSCDHKHADVAGWLNWWTTWRTRVGVIRGEIDLPFGARLDAPWWEWVPDGVPWWDQAKEIRGDLQAIGAGFDTPQRIVRKRTGGDWKQNIRDRKKAEDFAREQGVAVSWNPDQAPKEQPDQEGEQ